MALQEELENQGNFLFRYRSFFPLILLVLGFGFNLYTDINPGASLFKDTSFELYYEILVLLVGIAGLLIRVYTVGHAHKNTSGRNTKAGQVADSLNTSGIYSTVRHPLYLGNFLMWLAPVMLTGHIWFIFTFCLVYWIYYERIMYAEEQFLRRKFGAGYIQWSEHVNAFIPNLRQFSKPTVPFSLTKVLKQEKNGLFALFLIFCLFDVSGELVTKGANFNYFFVAMSVITGLFYLVIKVLSKRNII